MSAATLTLDEVLSEVTSDLGIARAGRRKSNLSAEVVRELTPADLLKTEVEAGIKPISIKEIRNTHHTLARLLAQGTKPHDAAIILGMSVSRISILKGDPAFSQLLSHYESMEKAGFEVARADMRERLAAVGFDAIEILHEKLLDRPEVFTPKELLSIVEASADRTGHGKTSTINHTHGLSEEVLARITSSAENGSPPSEIDRPALLRLAIACTAGEDSEGQEAERCESEGGGLREEGPGEPIDAEFTSGIESLDRLS
jgi:hypothetical protein